MPFLAVTEDHLTIGCWENIGAIVQPKPFSLLALEITGQGAGCTLVPSPAKASCLLVLFGPTLGREGNTCVLLQI